MNYKYILTVLLFSLSISQVSVSDIESMTNNKIDQMIDDLKDQSQKEVSLDVKPQDGLPKEVVISPPLTALDKKYFGYNYFNREINFFDNIPTPVDFVLGPGDEINLSLWGQVNLQESLTINKQGQVYFENIGLINISNMSLSEVEKIFEKKLSNIYSTITDGSTQLNVELGKLKSINVYFSGQINNPGISIVHPFSDVFTAIIQAGGIKKEGSLRNVQIIRSNNVIASVDFYEFFSSGKNSFSKIRILDNDVIHIPTVSQRVEIKGEINHEGFYELQDSESLNDLVQYAGGLTKKAASSAIIDLIIPISERVGDSFAQSSRNINLADSSNIILNNGDAVNIMAISAVASKVQVLGRVKNPGNYSYHSNLKQVLDLAGGFEDPFFRKTIVDDKIVILRKDDNQFYAKEIITSYSDANKVQLQPDDKIFIYEAVNYRNSFTYRVEGEINQPGVYPLLEGTTLEEAIAKAKGFTVFGNYNTLTLSKEFTFIDDSGVEQTTTEALVNTSKDFILSRNTVITVLPADNVIKVDGNVYNPGLVAYTSRMTMSRAIELAGGFKPYSMKKRAYVQRADGGVEKANLLRGRAKRIYPGDRIFVPINPNPSDFDITSFIADLSTTLANIAAILIIIDNN
ncbi:MAG: SLBB domain-containing protein [Candidatus Neomarinimicrobiota bacterium]